MTDNEDRGVFGLLIAATNERLRRIEEYLGIEGPTPAEVALHALLDDEGDDE